MQIFLEAIHSIRNGTALDNIDVDIETLNEAEREMTIKIFEKTQISLCVSLLRLYALVSTPGARIFEKCLWSFTNIKNTMVYSDLTKLNDDYATGKKKPNNTMQMSCVENAAEHEKSITRLEEYGILQNYKAGIEIALDGTPIVSTLACGFLNKLYQRCRAEVIQEANGEDWEEWI